MDIFSHKLTGYCFCYKTNIAKDLSLNNKFILLNILNFDLIFIIWHSLKS